MTSPVFIKDLAHFKEKEVCLKGWVYQFRSSGKISFLVLRDGTGECQCVFTQKNCDEASWNHFSKLSLESSVQVYGVVKPWKGGFEIQAQKLEIISLSENYPLSKKAHGTDFLLNHRHLWLRSKKQKALLQIRNELTKNIHNFFQQEGFIQVSAPILQPTASEGTSTLFPVDFFSEKQVFLSQTGQLYMEAASAALSKVYCFGPTFRAEKSSTRKHLLEFWMIEPEMAFCSMEEAMELAENFVEYVVQKTLETSAYLFEILERDTNPLKKIKAPFPRMTYEEAYNTLKKKGSNFIHGKDLGAKEESLLSDLFDKPLFIHHYPKKVKAFYMKEDPKNPELSLSFDLLASESYGELIGGSQREENKDILLKNMKSHSLNEKDFQWYLDLRTYGSFPHSGFGLGLERMLAWLCKLDHIREAIPFPRLYGRSFFETRS